MIWVILALIVAGCYVGWALCYYGEPQDERDNEL